MASHPYISGPGSVEQMILLLRKNFPATVTSETVKKFSLAPANESYVINALQFIGVIDGEGKRLPGAHDIFVKGDADFPEAFSELIRSSYKDLFEIRGEDAWTLSKADLASYFRAADKTSDVIGSRQAGLFQVFARLSGHNAGSAERPSTPPSKSRLGKPKASERNGSKPQVNIVETNPVPSSGRKEMVLTVRIEVNLPANGTRETYDNIFKSIKANLING